MTLANSQPIRVAIIGYGTSGRVFHAPFLRANPAFSVAAIVTSNAERAEQAARENPGTRTLANAEQVFEIADELDLVIIGTPPGTHFALTTTALDAGLDVVVDKPFVVKSEEGRQLIAQAERLGRKLTVFQNRRWDGDFLTVRELASEGALGSIHRFESRFEWWKPQPAKSWKSYTPVAEGGGIIFDLGTHLIDQAVQLFGPVTDLYAEARALGRAVADNDAFISLEHESGTISHLWMSSLAPQFGPRFHVLGDQGGFTSWGLDPQEGQLISGMDPSDEAFGRVPEERWGTLGIEGSAQAHPTHVGNYASYFEALAQALRGDRPVLVDPQDSVRVIEMIEQIYAQLGQSSAG